MTDHYVNFEKCFESQMLSSITQYGGGVDRDDHKFFNDDCSEFEYIPHILQPTDRTIAIGDVHGDRNVVIKSLKLPKLIEDADKESDDTVKFAGKFYRWIGGNTQVVQVGDQIDRCRPVGDQNCKDPNTTPNDEASDRIILHFYKDLNKVAMKHGGRVISLLGNHELMNVIGNMKYVSYKNIMDFADEDDPENVEKALNKRKAEFKNVYDGKIHDPEKLNRFLACTRVSAVIIGNVLFVHGGVVKKISEKYGIADINLVVRKWLLGKVEDELVADIVKTGKSVKDLNVKKEVNYLIGSKDSIFWNRFLGYIPMDINGNEPNTKTKAECDKLLKPVFKAYNIGSIVIGHTPQTKLGGMNSACGGRIWRVDIGASKAFEKFEETVKKRQIAVLQIKHTDNENIMTILSNN